MISMENFVNIYDETGTYVCEEREYIEDGIAIIYEYDENGNSVDIIYKYPDGTIESTTSGENDSEPPLNVEPTPDVVDSDNGNTTPDDPIIDNPSEEENPVVNNLGVG